VDEAVILPGVGMPTSRSMLCNHTINKWVRQSLQGKYFTQRCWSPRKIQSHPRADKRYGRLSSDVDLMPRSGQANTDDESDTKCAQPSYGSKARQEVSLQVSSLVLRTCRPRATSLGAGSIRILES
jgi:hypothetical protein